MSNKAETLNDAIVDKVKRVLDNTDYIDSMYITIDGNREEIPTIKYTIKEFIAPKEDTGNDG